MGAENKDEKENQEESKSAEGAKDISADKTKEGSEHQNSQEAQTKKRPMLEKRAGYLKIGDVCHHSKLPKKIYRVEDFEHLFVKETATATTED